MLSSTHLAKYQFLVIDEINESIVEQCLRQFLLRHNYVHCQGPEICEDCNLKADYIFLVPLSQCLKYLDMEICC